MLFNFANVLIFIFVGLGFLWVVLFLGRFFRPSNPTPDKRSTYECGERPIGHAWVRFNIRFYLIALIFLVFEVEVALIFPVALVFRRWVESELGVIALMEILVFIGILFFGLIYLWAKGDLSWIKTVKK